VHEIGGYATFWTNRSASGASVDPTTWDYTNASSETRAELEPRCRATPDFVQIVPAKCSKSGVARHSEDQR